MQLIQVNCLYLRSSETLILKTSTNISLNFLLRFWIVSILSCWFSQTSLLILLFTSFLISSFRFISDFSRNICERVHKISLNIIVYEILWHDLWLKRWDSAQVSKHVHFLILYTLWTCVSTLLKLMYIQSVYTS